MHPVRLGTLIPRNEKPGARAPGSSKSPKMRDRQKEAVAYFVIMPEKAAWVDCCISLARPEYSSPSLVISWTMPS